MYFSECQLIFQQTEVLLKVKSGQTCSCRGKEDPADISIVVIRGKRRKWKRTPDSWGDRRMAECGTLQKHEDEGGKAYYSVQLMLTDANRKRH